MKFAALVLIVFLAATGAAQAQQCNPSRGATGRFDFLLLSLSWSPAYCATARGGNNDEQCAQPGRHGFVVHGLWPQYSDGSWPQCCADVAPLHPSPVVDELAKVMPGLGLRRHEWKKHGSCVTTSQDEYFGRIMRVVATHRLGPDAASVSGKRLPVSQLKQYWPTLPPSSLSPACQGGILTEMRLCLSPALSPIPCPISVRDEDTCPGSVTLR